MTTQSISAEQSIRRFNERAELIGGLRALLDWLETHPTVPVPGEVRVQVSMVHGNETERVAAVLSHARRAHAQITQDDGSAITAELSFGDRVSYVLHASTDRGRRDFATAISYLGAVTP